MLVIFLTILALVVGLVFISISVSKKSKTSLQGGHEIPGPKPLPFIYNGYDYFCNKDDTLTWYLQQAEKHKYNFQASLPLIPVGNFICDPQDVEYVLKTKWENFNKGDGFIEISYPIFGKGIFNVNGSLWKSQRQTASHLFKINTMKDMATTFVKHGEIVLDILHKQSGTILDMQDLFHRYTLDSMGEIGFGKEIGSLNFYEVPFARNFDRAQNDLENAFYNPLWRFFPRDEEALKVINDFSYDVIKERKADPDVDKKSDLLSRYLCLRDEDGQPFTDQYLRDIVINFMIAGRDTTAQTLTWTLYLLSRDPLREKKVLEEIHSTLKGATPNYDNVKDMKYLKAVINESLRLYPPVPLDPKTAVEDDILPSGGRVYKGDYVIWCAYVLGRLKDFWGEDAGDFNPERWLDEARVAKYHPYQFVPFQAGPRICLGQNMAYLEAKVLLCMILPKFSFKLAPDFMVTYRRSVTLPAKYGLKMIVIPRENLIKEKILCYQTV